MSAAQQQQQQQQSQSSEASGTRPQTYFEKQRQELVREIALSLEQVLQNINRLNRNIESVIEVGNEFSSVEALWSQFETVMGRDSEGDRIDDEAAEEGREGKDEQQGDGNDNHQAGYGEPEAARHGDDALGRS